MGSYIFGRERENDVHETETQTIAPPKADKFFAILFGALLVMTGAPGKQSTPAKYSFFDF